jgi:hypothetical protein
MTYTPTSLAKNKKQWRWMDLMGFVCWINHKQHKKKKETTVGREEAKV